MWQNQPQQFNQYGNNNNNYYNIIAETTTFNPNPNASIDFVVTQVDRLSNQINSLVADVSLFFTILTILSKQFFCIY